MQFLAQMRSERVEKLQEVQHVFLVDLLVFVTFIDEDHHLGDRGVEIQRIDILADFLDSLVVDDVQGTIVLIDELGAFCDQTPYTVEPLAGAGQRFRVPRFGIFERSHEHFIAAQGIRAVGLNDIVGIDDEFRITLAHLDAVGTQDHALVNELLERFLHGNDPLNVEVVVPHTAVKQMTDRVFRTADIKVDRHPVSDQFLVREFLIVMRIDIAQEVPARAGRTRHRGGLSFPLLAVDFDIDPVRRLLQRRSAVGRFIVIEFRQDQRQLIITQSDHAVVIEMNDRDRFAPVTLTREDPFTDTVVDLLLTDTAFAQPFDHRVDCVFLAETVQEFGIDMDTVACPGFLGDISAFEDRNDLKTEFLREFIVTLIVRRDRHDGAGTVGS